MKRSLWMALLIAAGVASAACADEALQIKGFAAASYAGNFDRRSAQFTLDQAEVDCIRELGARGTVRVDLEWVWDGTTWAVAAEQGWLAYKPEFATGLTLTLGRFNAPIGFESLDPVDMYQVTHGLLFTYLTPANLTGAMGAYVLGHGFDVKAYAANDWDLNSENNGSPTFGGRFGWSGGQLSGGVSLLSGMRDAAQQVRNSVLDVDLSWTPAARLLFGAEFNACQARVAGDDAAWMGGMVMAHCKLTEWLGLTGRFDLINDDDDLVFASGLGESRNSVTLAPVVTLGPGMRLLGEVRMDLSSDDVFTNHDGEVKSSTTTGALSMTYGF